MMTNITLDEAIELLNKEQYSKRVVRQPIEKVQGLYSAEELYATMDYPPFPKSAMDGYAIADLEGEGKKQAKVIDCVYAGEVTTQVVSQGQAIRVMTGAQLPKGTLAVIKQEDVMGKGEWITWEKSMKIHENICAQGEDYQEGQLLIGKNKKLDYADIGLLASSNITDIMVYQKPRVAVISTGDEIVPIGMERPEGKIYNSNQIALAVKLEGMGYEVMCIHVEDDEQKLKNTLREFAKNVSCIFTIGGVSVGVKDLLKESMREIGAKRLFWKIKIKPGSSMLCSKLGGTWVISLSGNATAMMTTFELIGKGVLERLSGSEKIVLKREYIRCANCFKKKSINRRFLRGKIHVDGILETVKVTQSKHGNGILSALQDSDCLIDLEAGNDGVESGDYVWMIRC